MKVLIISDIHGSGYYAEKIKEIEEKEKPEEIIILGDLYYHGPRNELSQEYEPMKVAKILNSMKEKLTVIRGNCDAEVSFFFFYKALMCVSVYHYFKFFIRDLFYVVFVSMCEVDLFSVYFF